MGPLEVGNELRDIWVKMYRGDLRWGVRDERKRAMEDNWPSKDSTYLQKKDRNSWIAFSVLKSLRVAAKANEKSNYCKLMKSVNQ